jgi:hypothetical protein
VAWSAGAGAVGLTCPLLIALRNHHSTINHRRIRETRASRGTIRPKIACVALAGSCEAAFTTTVALAGLIAAGAVPCPLTDTSIRGANWAARLLGASAKMLAFQTNVAA